MKSLLNEEQLAYLKELESPKKRRKFMLDCLVENVLGESVKSVKISELPHFIFKDGKLVVEKDTPMCDFLMSQCSTTAPRTFKENLNDERFQLPSDVIQRSADLGLEGLRAINEAYEMAQKLKNDESTKKETQHLETGDFDFNFSLVNAVKEHAKKHNYSPEEIEMAKSLNSEREEKKWTDEDMRQCFVNSRLCRQWRGGNPHVFSDFEQYLKSIKNE
jgi:hypothetical protein